MLALSARCGAAYHDGEVALVLKSHRFTPSLADLHENHTKAGHTYADAAREIVRSTPDTLSLTRLQVLSLLNVRSSTSS